MKGIRRVDSDRIRPWRGFRNDLGKDTVKAYRLLCRRGFPLIGYVVRNLADVTMITVMGRHTLSIP